ncbi:MAG TPA: type II toxin-antitoxin system HipA family toxin [Bryobacteraceae bacterium]|nr:type II toxin-antitoxin system HipA family toxin [Bryobacteraceae bacterium]
MRPTSLGVNLGRRRIGIINRLAGDRQVFSFEEDYINDPARPTLSLSYKNRTGGLTTKPQQVNRRVPAFFSNLLPEGHLRTYLAERAGVHPEREFFLLAALGADLAGAVTIQPLDAASHTLEPDDPTTGSDVRTPRPHTGALRFSLAGVQLKFSAVMESAGGLTIPSQGAGGSWIVKLPSTRFEAVSENEFTMLELARAIGIRVPRIELVPVSDIAGLPPDAAALTGTALAVERFDRGTGGTRIHMEDFAQVFGIFPEGKYKSVSYANIARVLWAETGEQGTYEFVKRLAFSVLIGNADMHLKNWSLLYPDTRTPVLSPAYDFVAILPYIPNDQLALTFGGSRSLEAIEIDQVRKFTETAGLAGTPVLRAIQETIERTTEAWRKLAAKEVLPKHLATAIGNQIQRVAANSVPSKARAR